MCIYTQTCEHAFTYTQIFSILLTFISLKCSFNITQSYIKKECILTFAEWNASSISKPVENQIGLLTISVQF